MRSSGSTSERRREGPQARSILLAGCANTRSIVGIAGWKKAIANGDMAFSVGDGTPFVRAVSPENNERCKIMMTNTG